LDGTENKHSTIFSHIFNSGKEFLKIIIISKVELLIKNDALIFHSSYERHELIDLLEMLNYLVEKAPRRKLKSIYEKYCHQNFFEVMFTFSSNQTQRSY